MPAVRQRARSGHRTLSYLESTGPAVARIKPRVVILIHGFPVNADSWHRQLEDVPEGWRFVAVDLPGFGQSDPVASSSGGVSIDDYAAAVIDLMDTLQVESAVVGGLSMGGYVAFAMHRRAPTYFTGLLLANTRAQADSPEGRAGRQKMIELIHAEGAPAVARQMISKLLGASTREAHPDIERRVEAMMLEASAGALVSAVQAMASRPDSTPDLARIACPTLVVSGDEDTLIPLHESRDMAARIRSAEVEILAGAGHFSNLERPLEFNRRLARFLRDRV
jgi:pimeloyl-ACP methyl ester carboxylesterase